MTNEKKIEYNKDWIKKNCVICGVHLEGKMEQRYEARGNYCSKCNERCGRNILKKYNENSSLLEILKTKRYE